MGNSSSEFILPRVFIRAVLRLFSDMYINEPATFTDYYELTMAQGYFLSGKAEQKASFDYFYRSNPYRGGYVVFAGLKNLLETLENFSFTDGELEYLKSQGFDESFLEYLKGFNFNGHIFSVPEGEIIFPNTPILRAEGSLIESQIIETILLNILNFQSLIATKAARIRYAAGPDATLLDFGLRRSHSLAGIHASRAAIIGGFDGTSNVYSARKFGLNTGGTMAHSWVQSFDSELESFRAYAEHFPDSAILLVDTYNTLSTGLPNAITVARELREKGHELEAIRLDSGDLAYLAKKSRKMLDDAGFENVKIAASNQLDERVISSLINQGAPIDMYGVGTRLVTGNPDAAMDGVYKLSSVGNKPNLKVSENIEKITLPGIKTVKRYLNPNGAWHGDAIGMVNGDPFSMIYHPTFPAKKTDIKEMESNELLKQVMKSGKITEEQPELTEIAEYCTRRLSKLSPEFKRFDNPHIYKVGITTDLMNLRDKLLHEYKN